MSNLNRLRQRDKNLNYKNFLESRLHSPYPYNRRKQNTEELARLMKKIQNENIQLNETTRRTTLKAIAEEARNKTVSTQLKKLSSFKKGNKITYEYEGKQENGIVLMDYESFMEKPDRASMGPRILIQLNPGSRPNTMTVSLEDVDKLHKRTEGGKHTRKQKRKRYLTRRRR